MFVTALLANSGQCMFPRNGKLTESSPKSRRIVPHCHQIAEALSVIKLFRFPQCYKRIRFVYPQSGHLGGHIVYLTDIHISM